MGAQKALTDLFDLYLVPREQYEEVRQSVGEAVWRIKACDDYECDEKLSSESPSPLPSWEDLADLIEGELSESYRWDPEYWRENLSDPKRVVYFKAEDGEPLMGFKHWDEWRVLVGEEEEEVLTFKVILVPKLQTAPVTVEWETEEGSAYQLAGSVLYFPAIPVKIIGVYSDPGGYFDHKTLAQGSVWDPEDMENLIQEALFQDEEATKGLTALYVAYNPEVEYFGGRPKWTYYNEPAGKGYEYYREGQYRHLVSLIPHPVEE